jgi:hypothetical protein
VVITTNLRLCDIKVNTVHTDVITTKIPTSGGDYSQKALDDYFNTDSRNATVLKIYKEKAGMNCLDD